MTIGDETGESWAEEVGDFSGDSGIAMIEVDWNRANPIPY